MRIYQQFIGRHMLRKLTFWIALLLIAVFISLGAVTQMSFYQLLEDREQQLLESRTQQFLDRYVENLQQFDRNLSSFYTTDKGIDSLGQITGAYQHLLPSRVADIEDDQAVFLEERYFLNLLNGIKINSPYASDFILYRNTDGRIFHIGNESRHVLSESVDFADFFNSQYSGFELPILGTSTTLLRGSDQNVSYVLAPIFDFSNLKPDRILGYFMMLIDDNDLYGSILKSGEAEERITLVHQAQVILDNKWNAPKPENMLISHFYQAKYDLDVKGYVSKGTVTANLSKINWTITLILSAAWFLCLMLIYNILNLSVRRLRLMARHFNKHREESYLHPFSVVGKDEVSQLMQQFNVMAEQMKDYIDKVLVAGLQQRNAEYYALKMQINPHFLYNTLESIRMQAMMSGQKLLSDRLYQFGMLFRWLLQKDEADLVPIRLELDYTSYYLDLMSMGKDNPVELQIIHDFPLSDYRIVKFSLQPIIENAFIHGRLEHQPEPLIRITFKKQRQQLTIIVWNNGEGISESNRLSLTDRLRSASAIQHEHLGLLNVHSRILGLFGQPYGLSVMQLQPGAGFGIEMTIPLEEEAE
ncbi:MAG: histidine kinase [Gorillibacterium sp.]|nr:histidine kinase [Gorillibacterium sp.]